MAIKEFTFSDLSEFDGGVIAVAVNAALKRAAMDCDDRPGVKTARTIALKLSFVPVVDPAGNADSALFSFAMAESLPGRKSKPYELRMRKGGKLVFNPDALDNPDQETFPFDDDGKGKGKGK